MDHDDTIHRKLVRATCRQRDLVGPSGEHGLIEGSPGGLWLPTGGAPDGTS